MTKIGLRVILTWLLLSIVHGLQEPRCDLNGYGQPHESFCQIAIDRKFPITSMVKRFFGLETSEKPGGITKAAFAKRIALPFFGEFGRWSSSFRVCCGLLTVILASCKMAFLAIRFRNGSVSYDTSSWRVIYEELHRLESTCVGANWTLSRGGNLVVGEFSIFQRKSYDLPFVCMHRRSC